MDAYEAIVTRRSTRRFREECPDREVIEKIVEAGRYAPSGGNNQTTRLMVITDKEILTKLADLAKEEFSKMEVQPDTYRSLKNAILASKKGPYIFHYQAPVLIVTANKKGYGNALADSACVLENMMIAANAFDLGSCWINQLHWLDESPAIRKVLEGCGLSDDETITGGLVLGYAEQGLPVREKLERHGNPVNWN
ncbi:MAG: nitroreductase family protein [Lachnospiraceae bacterium]|nr:nitroreductase family protein [Lachnospiraceae bacterium]